MGILYSFSSLFILYVATESQKDHKLFSATYILCNKKIGNKKIEGSPSKSIFFNYTEWALSITSLACSQLGTRCMRKQLKSFCLAGNELVPSWERARNRND